MQIALPSELEAALNESARRNGVSPQELALRALGERFLINSPPLPPTDEWERIVLGAATDCGVSLPHSVLSSEGTVRLVAYLIDTSVLARLANSADSHYAAASGAVLELHRRGEILHITPQNLIEFRSVATRPVALNGLGLSPQDADTKAMAFESAFPLLPDTPDIFPAWKALVNALSVIGKQVHDARLVAVCHTHAVTHLLTFNTQDFTRFAAYEPGVTVVDPAGV